MAEVPEHLLRRSRERREALGLGQSGGNAGSSPTGEAGPPSPPSVATPTEPSGSALPVPTAAATVVTTDSGPSPREAMLARQATLTKARIPVWVLPVLICIPVWAFFYSGAFGPQAEAGPTDPLVLGQEVYANQGCGGCHGAGGEGNPAIGAPQLSGGEAELTFPDEADHIAWVTNGSPQNGQPYGDPNREGGPRIADAIMPAFGSTLSAEEIEAVVKYEREKL